MVMCTAGGARCDGPAASTAEPVATAPLSISDGPKSTLSSMLILNGSVVALAFDTILLWEDEGYAPEAVLWPLLLLLLVDRRWPRELDTAPSGSLRRGERAGCEADNGSCSGSTEATAFSGAVSA